MGQRGWDWLQGPGTGQERCRHGPRAGPALGCWDRAQAEPWLTQRGTRPFPCRRSKRGAVTQRGLAGAPSAFPNRREIRDEPQGQRESL